MRICNGAKNDRHVMLDDVPAPFTCPYTRLSLRAKSYVEVPIHFTPTQVGPAAAVMTIVPIEDETQHEEGGRGRNNDRHEHLVTVTLTGQSVLAP